MTPQSKAVAPRASSGTAPAKARRHPPSEAEQASRTQRIRPWADEWKRLKQSGRWSGED